MNADSHADAILAADPARIERALEDIARRSLPGAGITRWGYSQLEREAHELFAAHFRALGLECRTDAAGNTIATLPGTDPALAHLGTGSHLDSVPHGGRFDGIAGSVAAMEVARMLVHAGIRPRRSIRFVAFATEEGARFGQACLGSRMIAGLTSAEDLDALEDRDGVTAADALRGVGLDPACVHEARWHPGEVEAFIELHIEQGGILAASKTPIGVVDVISGSTRLAIDLTGTASHTGGTPMYQRADALAAAAAVVLTAERVANDNRHRGTRISVGKIDVEPGSITTIPGFCRVYVDVRDVDPRRQRDTANEVISAAHSIAQERGVGVTAKLLADTSPVTLPLAVQRHIVDAAASMGLGYRVMPSGASHDTQMIDRVCRGGMVFVPSLNGGVSHAPDEYSLATDIARGTDVLVRALLSIDAASESGWM